MISYYKTFSTPVGPFSVAVDETDTLVATAFGGVENLKKRFRTEKLEKTSRELGEIENQIAGYFSGKRKTFSLKTNPTGTPFQQRVWTELTRIPFGETRSYGDLARKLRSAPRAVGRANATNPICLIIPCHRVIGADGSLTGFAFGEKLKKQLLDLEAGAKQS